MSLVVQRQGLGDLLNAKYVFLLPWIAGFVLFTAGPFLTSLALSFTNYDLFRAPDWIGLDNYERMLLHEHHERALSRGIGGVAAGA